MPKKRYLEYAGRTDEPDIYLGNLISSKPTAGDKAASKFNTTMQNIIRKAVSANKTRDAKLKRERDAYFSKTKPVKTEKEVVLNDNTWVDNGRIKNPENKERSVKGGLSNAAWVADNPIKSTIGQIAGIAPFGVMAYPVLAEAGVAAAPIVNSAVGGTALTSILSGKPAWDMVSGNADWTTPIDLIPLYGPASKSIGAIGRRFNKLYRTAPKITAKNATNITPRQWTAAQDAAIARGDMAEAQRLRDLHFKVSAPDTQIKDIQYHGAKGNAKFNVFDPKLIGQNDQGWAGRGYYFTPSIDYAKMYGSEPRAFYINAQKVHDGTAAVYFGRENSPAASAFKIIRKRYNNDGQQILDELASSDAIRTSFLQTQPYNGSFEEVVTRNNNQMKLADAVTYNDNGVRIPLGERDNFRLNDIRYSWLPWFLGGISASTLYNILPTGRTAPNIRKSKPSFKTR